MMEGPPYLPDPPGSGRPKKLTDPTDPERCPKSRVSDLRWFNADPDPAFFLIADPDPAFFLIADPDPGFDDLKLKKITGEKKN